jgi:hypothetical protein
VGVTRLVRKQKAEICNGLAKREQLFQSGMERPKSVAIPVRQLIPGPYGGGSPEDMFAVVNVPNNLVLCRQSCLSKSNIIWTDAGKIRRLFW